MAWTRTEVVHLPLTGEVPAAGKVVIEDPFRAYVLSAVREAYSRRLGYPMPDPSEDALLPPERRQYRYDVDHMAWALPVKQGAGQ